jgi:hypothetical protein
MSGMAILVLNSLFEKNTITSGVSSQKRFYDDDDEDDEPDPILNNY